MCSVVGYIGNKKGSKSFVLEGLQRLSYRGYDSAGFACVVKGFSRLSYLKSVGAIDNLLKKALCNPIDGKLGIGHTRWASHGLSTENNAHPHFDCKQSIAVVHNGIVENFNAIKIRLLREGHFFNSHTDTEVVAHLLESLLLIHESLKSAVLALINMIEGAYAFIIILQQYPDTMILIRKRSPLCIGIGDNEMFVASDVLAFAKKTETVIFLPDESYAFIKNNDIEIRSFKDDILHCKKQKIAVSWQIQGKNGYEHFMLKEIYEQKNVMLATVEFLRSISKNIWKYIGVSPDYARNLQSMALIGSGTSWHAAKIGKYFFESICSLPTQVSLSSEFRYEAFFPKKSCLYTVLSQSGETADTLEALRLINTNILTTVVVTNVASSTMVREAGGFLLTHAGPEVAVASTKSFSAQLTVLYWLAHRLALEKGIIAENQLYKAEEELIITAELLESNLEKYRFDIIDTYAKKYSQYNKALFVSRHIGYPFALEAALKLKEVAYVFSQGFPAGELKHGPLALIDKQTPVFIFSHQNPTIYQKLLSNVQEVKARNGHIIVFAFEGQDELISLADTSFVVEGNNSLLDPLCMTGLMQFLVYAIAKETMLPIDQPRNLAKSVTV